MRTGLRQSATNVIMVVILLALLAAFGLAGVTLFADQITLHAINAGPREVRLRGCGPEIVVPAGSTARETRTCWRARELTAHEGDVVVDRVTVSGKGVQVYNVAGRAPLHLVDYSAAYAHPDEYHLSPDARAVWVADLRHDKVVAVSRVATLLPTGAPLPGERLVGSKVLRLETAPPGKVGRAALETHFTEVMRAELTPGGQPVRLDFRSQPAASRPLGGGPR
jgi:hypothetical protein